MSKETVKVDMARVRIDGGTQMRLNLDQAVVHDYAQILDQLPPIKCRDDGKNLWLTDGFHTYRAHELKNCSLIRCDITPGSLDDAIRDALGANATHGLRRSNADKRNAVYVAMTKFPDLSVIDIARLCAVSRQFVYEISKKSFPGRFGEPEKCKRLHPTSQNVNLTDDSLPGLEPSDDDPQGSPAEDGQHHPADSEYIVDDLGHRCENDKVILAFRQKMLMTQIASAVQGIKNMAEGFWDTPASRNVSRQQFDAAIKQLRSIWKSAIPYAVCPLCKGDGCDTCGHGGFVTQEQYENGIPKDLRWPGG